jgi:SAM-dependent methyltransferase/DNA-directed RNA polymerase subunit RPC12/RpoP
MDSKIPYICTKCDVSLLKKTNTEGAIAGTVLQCPECNVKYPVKDGVPRFLSGKNYTDSFGYQWNIHRKTQLDSFSGLPITRNRLFTVTNWPERMEGQTILEAGSGAGRFTEVLLSTGAEVFSFDYSSAVEANRLNNGHSPKLHLFQGDIYDIPLEKNSFDKVICLGVLQHTPDPERAFRCLAQHVKPGGELVIDIYAKKFTSLLHWKYILRPLTKHIRKEILYKIIERVVPIVLPISVVFRKAFGKIGSRILPIVEYSNLGLPYDLNKQWAILDTFDMYSPRYDTPQNIESVEKWFRDTGFSDVTVEYGSNGIIGKGRRLDSND